MQAYYLIAHLLPSADYFELSLNPVKLVLRYTCDTTHLPHLASTLLYKNPGTFNRQPADDLP